VGRTTLREESPFGGQEASRKRIFPFRFSGGTVSLFDDGATLALGRALDGVSLRQRVTADNVANVMTPGFRAQKVDFEDSLASAVSRGDPTAARSSVTGTGAAAREDGNNVEIDRETTTLMRSGVQYQALAQALSFKFSVLHSAIKG